MNRKYARPEVKQVTRQWVRENCKNVTDRDKELLKVIEKHRILRRDHIEILFPEFPSSDYLNKRLAILYKMHMIDRTYPQVGLGEGSSKQHVCLDRAGMILLDNETYNKPIRPDKSLPLGWEHIVTLNDYKCRITQFFKKIGGKVLYCELEQTCRFSGKKLIADIILIVQHNKKGHSFIIEVDLGTENLPFLKKKIDSYRDYYLTKTWVGEPWARVFKTPVFPRVLLMTENGRVGRINSLREYTKDSGGIRFLVDQHNNLEKIFHSITKG